MNRLINSSRRRRPRALGWVALATATFGSLMTVSDGTRAAAAPPDAQAAPVVQGLQKVQSPAVTNSLPYKSAVARCPAGKKVVGGGGWTMTSAVADEERLTLTQLEPRDNVDGTGADGYIASAAETSPGVSGTWWVQAYALCAYSWSVPGWNINAAYTGTLSDPVQRKAVGCDNSGQRVLGTGARIGIHPLGAGQVGLQVARASGPGDITRAQAHEDADGYGGTWWLGAYAICANTPSGYEVVSGASTEQASETFKDAHANCSSGKHMLSSGAAITDVAPGHVSLQQVYPNSGLTRVDALAVENTPLNSSWDFIIARGICVNRP